MTAENSIIVDDEKYFAFSGNNMPGNFGFYATNKEDGSSNVRFKLKQKYQKKILVWLAICNIFQRHL